MLPISETPFEPEETHNGSVVWTTTWSMRGRRRHDFRCAGPGARKAAEHRHADDGRHRLERFRRLFQRRQGARPSDAECRPDRRGRRDLHQLVRPGELHRRPRLVHHRAHSDPLGAVDRRRAGRPEHPPQGDADDRRVLQEERLFDLLLRQVASRRQARSPIRSSTASTR